MTSAERGLRGQVVERLHAARVRLEEMERRATEADGIVSARRLRQLAEEINKIAELQGDLRAMLLSEE